MAVAAGPELQEQIVHLRVSWATYEALASGIGEDNHALLAYDGETLELMSPTTDHEAYAKLIDALLTMIVTEWDVNLYNTGSSTLKAEPLGAEPDTSYYSDNAAKVGGQKKLISRTARRRISSSRSTCHIGVWTNSSSTRSLGFLSFGISVFKVWKVSRSPEKPIAQSTPTSFGGCL
jgi:hypothetical protein